MDIIRLFAQQMEAFKPVSERNPFVQYGSCDSYALVGDGSYSPESLVEGFNAYSEAVSSLLAGIIPRLETQGVRNMLFEGVQLTPSLVAPYLVGDNRLIIITSSEPQLRSNIDKLFGENQELKERYSIERLLLLQAEILRQSREISPDRLLQVDNTEKVSTAVSTITGLLLINNVIQPI